MTGDAAHSVRISTRSHDGRSNLRITLPERSKGKRILLITILSFRWRRVSRSPNYWPPAWKHFRIGSQQYVALGREPELRLSGKASYDVALDELQLPTASIEAVGLNVAVSGNLQQARSAQQIDLTGKLDYNWDLICLPIG